MAKKTTLLSIPDSLMVRNARLQSRGHKLWLEILIFLLILVIASVLQSLITTVPLIVGMFQTPAYQEMLEQASNGTFQFDNYLDTVYLIIEQLPSWTTVVTLFATAATIVTVLFYCTKVEKRKVATLGLTHKKRFSEYAIGLGIGLFLFILVFGLNLLFGAITLKGFVLQPQMLPMLLVTLLGYGIQGASEEILCRGYLCNSISRWMPLWVGLIVNSIAFSLLHLANSGVSPLALLNIFLFGVFMTLYMIRRGNLWGACAIHTIWNFAQGNIFGLQVSGMSTAKDTIFSAQNVDGMSIWNGGTFGPEGGLCVTIVLVAAILVVWLFCKNRDLGQTAMPVPDHLTQKAIASEALS